MTLSHDLVSYAIFGDVLLFSVPGVGLTPVLNADKPDKDRVSRLLSQARHSSASMGKFDETVPKEKPVKKEGKKRKVCLE